MHKRLDKKFSFTWIVLLLFAFQSKAADDAINPDNTPSSDNSVSLRQNKSPNSELENSLFQWNSIVHNVVKKNPRFPFFYQVSPFYKPLSPENLQIKISSLLVKKYLFFIFPSHNFW